MKRAVLVLLMVISFTATPVLAQDGITVTIPPVDDGGSNDTLPYILAGLAIVSVFGMSVVEHFTNRKVNLLLVDHLYKSTPSIIRQPVFDFVTGTAENFFVEFDKFVKSTKFTDLDDRAKEKFWEAYVEAKRHWSEKNERPLTDTMMNHDEDAVG